MESGSREQSDPIVSINVTPLVDVSLVLVIIFMIAAPLAMQSGIGLKTLKKQADSVPQAEAAPEVRTEVMIRLVGDQVTVNDQSVEEAKLPYFITGLLSKSTDKLVYIAPADDVLHGQLVRIMDLVRQCGAQHLAIVENEQANTPTAQAATAANPAPVTVPPAEGKP